MSSPADAIEAVLDESGPDYDEYSFERSSSGTRADVFFVTVVVDGSEYEVVVKFEPDDDRHFDLEPYIQEYVGERTDIPVPGILVFRDDPEQAVDPYFITARIQGDSLTDRLDRIDPDAQNRVLAQAGRMLGDLHDSIAFEGFGRFELDDGHLAIRDLSWDWQTYFKELTESRIEHLDGTPFEDAAGRAQEALDAAIEAIPSEGTPRLVHDDFRPGNLLVDPDREDPITVVLDWQELIAAPEAYNVAQAEFLFVDSVIQDPDRQDELRDRFREAYQSEHDLAFDEAYDAVAPLYQLSTLLWRMGAFEDSLDDDATELKRARAEAYYRGQFEQLIDRLPD
ncbi:phosphotransferase family protein [Halococcoides cellulosivorans]|uniref:Phosphotransferase n=1 Tax=Halococcoides cellulosivorans TaxID=1679096 RepID=A0A2R4X2F0_9EURY|nr:phosphotransferase [Halococcoides cellulosivorans]AWB27954.1 phosphotransferase [Halococcoides cellulosivorans]